MLTSWRAGFFWEESSGACPVCDPAPRDGSFRGRPDPELAGRHALRLHHGRTCRLPSVLVAASLSILADGRCCCASIGRGNHAGTHRLLPGGCCYGSVCDLPWAVRFPKGTHAWLGQIEQGILPPAAEFSLPVHPTQLYAALAGVIILAIRADFPRRRRDGEVDVLLMILYPLTRWPIESLRGDETAMLAEMTLSQNISVGLLLLGWSSGFSSPVGLPDGMSHA